MAPYSKCLICGWPMGDHSESQIRTCQHRHEELKKKRRDETVRRVRREFDRAMAADGVTR